MHPLCLPRFWQQPVQRQQVARSAQVRSVPQRRRQGRQSAQRLLVEQQLEAVRRELAHFHSAPRERPQLHLVRSEQPELLDAEHRVSVKAKSLERREPLLQPELVRLDVLPRRERLAQVALSLVLLPRLVDAL